MVLRQILVEEAGEAARILSILKEDPEQFQVLAERHSASPDRGQPRPYEEQQLPEAMRAVIFALSPGQVSDVVEEGGKYRIFQAVDRHEGKNQTLEEVRRKIERMLLQRKAEEALSRALSEVKRGARITVHVENLPFTYEGSTADEAPDGPGGRGDPGGPRPARAGRGPRRGPGGDRREGEQLHHHPEPVRGSPGPLPPADEPEVHGGGAGPEDGGRPGGDPPQHHHREHPGAAGRCPPGHGQGPEEPHRGFQEEPEDRERRGAGQAPEGAGDDAGRPSWTRWCA